MYIAPTTTKAPKVQFVRVKLCPICGEPPHREECDLGRPGGHGYPGHSSYQYKCECCGLVKGIETHDIYGTSEDAKERAKLHWNEEVDRVAQYIDRIYVSRALVENNVE